jgi:hypothetical protein
VPSVPGAGPFCAAKYAVDGLIESLLYEIDVFNIKATLVELSHMGLDEPDTKVVGSEKYSAFKAKATNEAVCEGEHAR